MQKSKLVLIPIVVGVILLILSWWSSYPVSIESPYDFEFNHFSPLYWLSLVILFASLFLVGVGTKSNTVRWAVTIGTVLLMFSHAYFSYMLASSDSSYVRGLTEYFISTGDLSTLPAGHEYYQWPFYFILGKIAVSISGLDLRLFEFVLHGLMSIVVTSFVYLYILGRRRELRFRARAYVAVMAFFIILSYFFNFQWASPFSLSLCLILVLFHLDGLSGKRLVILAMLLVFACLTFVHIVTPILFVGYCLGALFVRRNIKYLKLSAATSVIYFLKMSYDPQFTTYVKELTSFSFSYILSRVQVTMSGYVTTPPYISVVAQFFSRTVVIVTMLLTGLGFVILLRKRKLGAVDYVMLLTGAVFAVPLFVAPSGWEGISGRTLFLLCLPVSLGAAHLCEDRFKKYFKPAFLVLLLLFTFALMHQSFYDRQIFFQTKQEYQCSKFILDAANWNESISILSHFRFMEYLKAASSSVTVYYGSDFYQSIYAIDVARDMVKYNYVIYTVGLSKSFSAYNYSIEATFKKLDDSHYDLIYNSGNLSCIFSR